MEKNNKGKEIDKGWTCDLIPKELVIATYLAKEQQAVQDKQAEIETFQAEYAELEEEHTGEEGVLADATNDNVDCSLKDRKFPIVN